jgi:hypothetical protein
MVVRVIATTPEPNRPEPLRPEPDDKDWTWVLDRPCVDCGFDGTGITGADVAGLTRASVPRWRAVLGRADAAVRPAADVWSPLEYGCHVRDVFAIFDGRAQQMLSEDDPLFANWDQDATALELRYWEQSPPVVADELASTGEGLARTFDGIAADQWNRPGRRSNGSVFTVDSLGRYFLHDLVHHLHDVNG